MGRHWLGSMAGGLRASGVAMILDVSARTLTDGERTATLTPASVTIMRALVRVDRVSFDALIRALWPNDEPSDAMNTLTTHIYKLRRTLRDADFPPLVGSVFRFGLTLNARVTITNDGGEPAVIPADMVPLLRAILYRTPGAASDRLLALVGA